MSYFLQKQAWGIDQGTSEFTDAVKSNDPLSSAVTRGVGGIFGLDKSTYESNPYLYDALVWGGIPLTTAAAIWGIRKLFNKNEEKNKDDVRDFLQWGIPLTALSGLAYFGARQIKPSSFVGLG